jgi:hypothetical protein
MSTREWRRAEVLGRVKGQTPRLVDGSKDAGCELSAGSQRAAASQRQEKFESGEAREIPAEAAATGPREVLRNGAGAVWTYAGSGTFGGGRWVGSGGGDAATLDVGGGLWSRIRRRKAHRKR